jgi:hypothetical protein
VADGPRSAAARTRSAYPLDRLFVAHGNVLDDSMSLKGLAPVLVVEQVVFRQLVARKDVEHEIRRTAENVVVRARFALLQPAVIDLYDDARAEPQPLLQFNRRVNAAVQSGREQPVVVDAHDDVGEKRRLANIEFAEHRTTLRV